MELYSPYKKVVIRAPVVLRKVKQISAVKKIHGNLVTLDNYPIIFNNILKNELYLKDIVNQKMQGHITDGRPINQYFLLKKIKKSFIKFRQSF
tara:strand:- start:7438 stop:7716 length:279 start_codon:yes stop_codon:yes gene_type:complete